MNSSNLSVKLWLSIIPFVLLLMLIQGVISLTNLNNALEKQAEILVTRHFEQQVTRIQNYTELYKPIVDLISTSPKLNNHLINIYEQDDPASEKSMSLHSASIEEFGKYIESLPNILSIGVINPQGKVENYYPKDLNDNREKYEFDKRIRDSDKQQNLFFIDENGSTSIYLTLQLFDPRFSLNSPQVIGYLIIHIDDEEIEQSVANSYYPDSINFIMDNSGKILFSNQPEYKNTPLSGNELNQLKNLTSLTEFSELALPTLTLEERMVISNSMDNGLHFVTALDKNSLYSDSYTITRNTSLLILFTAFILSLIIYFVVRHRLLNPIETLVKASNQVGEGDYMVRLEIDRNDEIGMLFKHFNRMIHQVRQYQNELLYNRNHVEEKVISRTKAIAEINKKLEKAIVEAEQANNLKSRFLANMSHEIRTPLTAIIGFTETMSEQELDREKAVKLDAVMRNSKHLLELINNILDLSKIEADKLEVETRPVEVIPLIHDIETIIKPLAADKQLELTVNIDYPLPNIIHSDVTRLKQILLNICINAVKFTEKGYVAIHLKYCQTNEKLIFTIIDSGIGMTKHEQARIFKPFEQADISTTRKFGGTGLGLCIAKNLTHILGGDITVNSKFNQGSKFEIEIATYNEGHEVTLLTRSPLPDVTTTVQQAEIPHRLKGQILVAEDNEDNQQLISLLLNRWGITPEFVNNGVEAVEKALFSDFDLILMDMQMPVMGGLEATKVLRSAAYNGPIVALTANVMKKDTDAYLAAGCNKTLAKPIDRNKFEQVLHQYLVLERESQCQQFLLNDDYLGQMSKDYKVKLPNLLKQVKNLHEQQNHKELVDLAHIIKGSAGSFGFTDITQAAAQLETSLHGNMNEKINPCVLELMQTIELSIDS